MALVPEKYDGVILHPDRIAPAVEWRVRNLFGYQKVYWVVPEMTEESLQRDIAEFKKGQENDQD